MKSKEEIEQLAEKNYTQITLSQRTAFVFGYTQCQEDMDDKKYTLDDMKKCWDACKVFIRPISEGYAPNFNEFINSLNKQD